MLISLPSLSLTLFALAHLSSAQEHGESGAQEMGPMAFLWPPDREWSDDYDNTSPCGSATGARNRTDFPLEDGAIALVMQDSTWNIEIAIYYGSDNPTSISQFTDILPEIASLEAGHKCYYIEDQNSSVTIGENATFEIRYTAVDDSVNATQYACADVTFVSVATFNETIPCFNVSYSDYSDSSSSSSISSALESLTSAESAAKASSTAAPTSSGSESASSSSAVTSSSAASSSEAASSSSVAGAMYKIIDTGMIVGQLAALAFFLV
ncbi:hypothetical protein BZA70DRAFT_278680 [Myxozyma melibiosi]|uniref:Copper acquisition factor BIM1-like domain-containing protein n=1 Tax=Myxozyma melibiosi TaxID=54550 RepID=A0ABR1F4Z2_9ASCO